MRLLLDEMLAPSIARGLRERDFDAVAVLELRLQGATDAALIQIGRKMRRVIATKNVRDFRKLQNQSFADGDGHFGLILIASHVDCSRAATGNLVSMLARIAEDHPADDDLRNREICL